MLLRAEPESLQALGWLLLGRLFLYFSADNGGEGRTEEVVTADYSMVTQ